MTRYRRYGSDHEFMSWLRGCPSLPSVSRTSGTTASDVDAIVHRYMTCMDGVGSRKLQRMMFVEAKTRSVDTASISTSQTDTWRKVHHCLCRPHMKNVVVDGNAIVHYGGSYLMCSGQDPETSERMLWGRFGAGRSLSFRDIDLDQLILLLKFEIHPDTMSAIDTDDLPKAITTVDQTPHGWPAAKLIVER